MPFLIALVTEAAMKAWLITATGAVAITVVVVVAAAIVAVVALVAMGTGQRGKGRGAAVGLRPVVRVVVIPPLWTDKISPANEEHANWTAYTHILNDTKLTLIIIILMTVSCHLQALPLSSPHCQHCQI